MKEIYLDNAATTKPLDSIAQLYKDYAQDLWYNPSSLYKNATIVNNMINTAREDLLFAFNSRNHNCIFTSGGTEGANTVILKGGKKTKNMNYVCALAEHACVEESYKHLESLGAQIRYAEVDSNGLVKNIEKYIDENTALVSVIHVNNETGAKNNICGLAQTVKKVNKNTLFHSDGVQAFLRDDVINTDLIDYYTVSAHKTHGLKGTGCIFIKKGAPLKPYALGGGQENALRSGTQNTFGILAFAHCAKYYKTQEKLVKTTLKQLKEVFLNACSKLDDAIIVTPRLEEHSCNHIVSLGIRGINSETLLHVLEEENIYISTGSACSSKKGKSRIASALNMEEEVANGSIRVSFSHFNTIEEIELAAKRICEHTEKLRKYFRK